MILKDKLIELQNFAEQELNENILTFWRTNAVDHENGGFFGEISNDLIANTQAPKGLVLTARILWTFSASYQLTNNKTDKELADRAFLYLTSKFYDSTNGGYYWTIEADGTPKETRKQIYALAFVIYGLSEYYKISKLPEALERAINLFKIIEDNSFDPLYTGYFEAFNRDWSSIDDMRLSAKDLNEKKSMNTHLHILEAYTNLFTVWKDNRLKIQLKNLINNFLDIIIDTSDNHLQLFFGENWDYKASEVSYGHDIEAGWLVHESALILGDKELINKVEYRLASITDAAMEGLSKEGGLTYESDRNGNHLDLEYEWWPQAEALVGLLNTYQVSDDEKYIDSAMQILRFIQNNFIDKKNGEWFFRVDQSRNPIMSYPKAGLWKCPYHNGRACIELIKRLKN